MHSSLKQNTYIIDYHVKHYTYLEINVHSSLKTHGRLFFLFSVIYFSSNAKVITYRIPWTNISQKQYDVIK